MIKEIKTEKFEGLAVLLPEEFKEYAGANGNELFYWTETCTQQMGDYPHSVHVPNINNYEIIGRATELTEEQCEHIARQNPLMPPQTFRQRFDVLMHAMECYSVNPLQKFQGARLIHTYGSHEIAKKIVEEVHSKYNEAKKQTGTWLILERIQ